MLFRLLLLSIFLFFSVSSQAQLFEPGYLVRSSGDTLRGEIENDFWNESPKVIYYRATPESPSQSFLPRQLRAVSLTQGRLFRYAILPIDYAARSNVRDLTSETNSDIHTDSLLAEVLIDGPLSLVKVNIMDLPEHYLLLMAQRPPLDLSERKYLRRDLSAYRVTNANNYKGQLLVYLGDCPVAATAAQKIPFTASGLASVVQAYNTSCSTARRPGRDVLAQAVVGHKVAFQGGLLTGARFNHTSPISDLTRPISQVCIDCQLHPFAGLYAEVFQPARTTAIYGELGMSKFRSRATFYYPAYRTAGTFDYNAWLATARLGIRFFKRLPYEQQLFFGLGYELNLIIKPTYTSHSSATLPNPQTSDLVFAKPTFLPNVTVGWRRQRLSIFLDGQMYVTSTDSNAGLGPAYFGSDFSARVGLSYRLGRNPDVARPTATR